MIIAMPRARSRMIFYEQLNFYQVIDLACFREKLGRPLKWEKVAGYSGEFFFEHFRINCTIVSSNPLRRITRFGQLPAGQREAHQKILVVA